MPSRDRLPRWGLLLCLLPACQPSSTSRPTEAPTVDPAASAPPNTASPAASDSQPPTLGERVRQFAVAEVGADVSSLSASQRDVLAELIEASKELDPVFDRQAWVGNPALAAELRGASDDAGRARCEYFQIMRGPWDRQRDHAPFAVEQAHPKGAGFYPEDLTAAQFEAWVAAHPDEREAFERLTTVIAREGEALKAIPYSEAYAQWLEPAAAHLEAAAKKTKNRSLRRFLRARARAMLTDDYYVSDKLWMDLDSRIEITIGPYETYEDQLLGLKASFESFVTLADPAASEALAKYKSYLPEMEDHLPVSDDVKTTRGAHSPIRVVDLVYSSGDARKSVQTIAFNLPNDERVRKEKGAKKVLLRNLIETKFDLIMKPIGQRVLAAEHHPLLSSDAFFHQVLFHELSHSLGPAFTEHDGRKTEVRLALGPIYSPLEECKADVMGAYNILFMIDEGELPTEFRHKLLASYFAGLFRSVRFGVAEAHGQGAAIQLNRYLQDQSVTVDDDGRFVIDFARFESSVGTLLHDLIMLQHEGDRAAAEAFADDLGELSEPIRDALARLETIPVDIRPVYPLAGETAPPGC